MSVFRTTQFVVYGSYRFGKAGFEARRNKTDLADMAGKTVMVTGANAGIGLEVAKQLIAVGADVIAVCRRRDEAAMQALRDVPRGTAKLMLCDVSSESSVKALLAECQLLRAIDVLVLNAGVMLSERAESVDGLDMTLATNIGTCSVCVIAGVV